MYTIHVKNKRVVNRQQIVIVISKILNLFNKLRDKYFKNT